MEASYNKFQVSKMFGEYQIVLRTDTSEEMLQALKGAEPIMKAIEEKISGKQITAENDVVQRQIEQTVSCPKCGSPLQDKTTKTGKHMKKCSKNGWDPVRKVSTGCDYVLWLDN